MGFSFWGVIRDLAYLCVITTTGYLVVYSYRKGQPQREHKARKQELAKVPAYQSDEDGSVTPAVAAKQRLKFMGVPSVDAGQHLMNVPAFNPEKAQRWDNDLEVLTTMKVMAYTKQGADPLDFIELSGGYVLVACAGKELIFTRHNLTGAEADDLQDERQAAVDRGDGMMTFEGHEWRITGAYGSHANPKPGERSQSYLQVLTVHSRLGEPGFTSILPPALLDLQEHDYFDLRARQVDGDQILFAFYAGGAWACFIGRVLEETEADQIQAI